MILKLLIIKVFLLFYVTSAKLKLIHNVKYLVNHNDTENPFNNTFDYNDLITLNETMEGKDEIEKLSSATATTSSVIVPTTIAATITTEQPFKYATTYNQISLKDDKDENEEEDEQQHLKYHYKRHYTTLKFNNNNNLNSNRLKTFSAKDVAATETTTNNTQTLETTMIPITTTTTTFNENKNLKDLENTDDNVENDDDDDDDVDNIEENDENLQQKHQTKLYASSNSYYGNAFVGQLPQFQLQQQQLQLYQQQQQQGQQLQQQQPLLPQEYHHLSDYRLLFNPERHTEFYLHTLTTTPPPAIPPATPSRTSTAATPLPPIPPQDDGYDSTRDETVAVHDKDDAHDIVHDDVADDDDADNDTLMMTTTNVTNPRVLTNVVTDTIGAAFGVNTRPVAAIHGIRIEAIELYNGLSLRQSRFNPFNPCRILIHGWLGGLKAGIYNTLVPEYLKLQQGRYNVFTVDWGKGAIADYITASYRVKPVGKIVAKFIDFLHQESGVPFEHIQVIGFSMGAHIAGIAGKYIQTGRLPVIYALDPALPLFRYENRNERLDRSDADYVEVVHTSAGSYGYDHPLGHVDFYINFGYNQPGCFFNECSHLRAYQIFAQALQKEVLVGRECSVELWLDMVKHKRCISETGSALAITAEGLNRSIRALRRGLYYVITNSQPPFKIT